MTPIEMLEATQKTVGSPEMLEAHALLKELGKEFLAIKKELGLKWVHCLHAPNNSPIA